MFLRVNVFKNKKLIKYRTFSFQIQTTWLYDVALISHHFWTSPHRHFSMIFLIFLTHPSFVSINYAIFCTNLKSLVSCTVFVMKNLENICVDLKITGEKNSLSIFHDSNFPDWFTKFSEWKLYPYICSDDLIKTSLDSRSNWGNKRNGNKRFNNMMKLIYWEKFSFDHFEDYSENFFFTQVFPSCSCFNWLFD